MSDWKDRATPVKDDWKSRATPAADASGNGEGSPGVAAMGTDQTPAPQTLSSKLQNTLAGYGQGATAGYMPQINGGIQAAGDVMSGRVAPSEFGDDYLKERDAEMARQKKASEENPYLYTGGKVAGIAGGTVAGGRAVGGLAKLLGYGGEAVNASRLAKVAAAAGTGGAIGLAQNPGDKPGEIDPVQAQARIKNGEVGAMTGGLISGAGQAASEYAPSMLKQLAGTQAFKALGPYARQARQAMSRGEVADIGNTALDESVIGGMPTSFKGIADRAAAAKAARGEQIGSLLGKMSETEGAPTISRKEIADQMRSELIEPHTDVASVAAKNEQLSSAIDHFEQGGNENIPLLEAEMKKRALDKNINWRRLPQDDVPVAEQGDRALRGKLARAVEDKAAQSDPELASQFGEAKDAYGNLDKAENISRMRAGHEMAKTLLAPTIGGTFGFAHGNTLEERLKNAAMGVAGGAAIRAGSLYGPQLIAPAARGAAKYMVPYVTKINPWLAGGASAAATQGEP